MIKRVLLTLMCVVLSTIGCMHDQELIEDGLIMEKNEIINEITETTSKEVEILDNDKNKNKSLVEKIEEMIVSVKHGSGKDIYWDGTTAEILENDLDQSGIVDGQVIEKTDMFIADKLFLFQYPYGFTQSDVDKTGVEQYHFVKGDSEIFINEIEYSREKVLLDSDENYTETESLTIQEDSRSQFKQFNIYLGVKELGGEKKVGYVLILENNNELAPRSYKLEVYGLGSLNYLKKLALTVMNTFSVIWYSFE